MTIDERIEAAANDENPVNALRNLADDIAHESGTGAGLRPAGPDTEAK